MADKNIKIIYTVKEMQKFSDSVRKEGKTIALVPTMGYLHEGHLSLVRQAKKKADVTVVSIFVNPTQFSPEEDLEKYPRDFQLDKQLLSELKVDVIFSPEVSEIYSHDFQTYVKVEEMTKSLEGASRPTHFRGVTTIVNLLFNCVKPDLAVFGQKDAQQAAVIRQMVKDLKLDINLIVAPIVREADGLAMSSRNVYLSPSERKEALVLSKALKKGKEMISRGENRTDEIYSAMKKVIDVADSSNLDYIKIVYADNFEEAEILKSGNAYYVLIACRIGKTRLIDNSLIDY